MDSQSRLSKRFCAALIFLSLLALPALAYAGPKADAPPRKVRAKTPRLATGAAFDSDDNLIILSDSKVYIVDKAGKEKAVSTGDWAIVKNELGKPGPYKDYHLNDDPIKGSFREFGNFVEDLKKTIARGKLPGHTPAEWQGPSWPAFKAALDDGDTSRLVAIISARGIKPSDYFQGLKLLKDNGYIDHLPLLKHVYTVGDPKFATLGATIPEKKLGAMKLLLDEIEAAGLPAGVAPITNREGTGTAVLNLWGFSDDDWDNYRAALDGLSKEVKKGKWPHIKVSLFFTGKNNPAHKPVNVVLQSDGTSREMLPNELEQWMRGRKARPAQAGGEVVAGASPEPVKVEPKGGARPLPPSSVVKSGEASVEDNITRMSTSYPFPTSNPKVSAGVDLTEVEVKEMRKYIADKSIPNAKKRIILTRYEVGNSDVIDTLIQAKKEGIPVTFINDFNTSLDYKFAPGEKSTVEFAKATLKDGANARQLQRLYDAGFKLNGSDWAIYSQPLYPADSMAPIMHEKSLILLKNDKPVLYIQGTNNMTDNIRVNRSFTSGNQQLADYAYQHAKALETTFAKGGSIKDVPSLPPLRIINQDGSFIEMAYTDGKFNPNDRIAAVLADGDVERVVGSNFVMTNGKVMDAMEQAALRNPNMKTDLVVDQQFIDPRGYGMAGETVDFDVVRPMGQPIQAWPEAARKSVNLRVWQLDAPGRAEKVLGGPPVDRVLWHDKTMVIYKREGGKLWAYVFTGSLNNSNHFANAELQQMWRLPADSPIVKAIDDSVMLVAKAHPEAAVPGEIAIERIGIGRLVGHRETEVPIDKTEALLEALSKNDFDAVAVRLGEIAKLPTSLEKHLSPAEVQANIGKLTKALKWYKAQPALRAKPISPPEFFDLADLVARPNAAPRANEYILKSILGNDDAAVKAGAAELDLRLPGPNDAPMNGHGLKPDHMHASVPVPSQEAVQKAPKKSPHEVPGEAGRAHAVGLPNNLNCIKAFTRAAGLLK